VSKTNTMMMSQDDTSKGHILLGRALSTLCYKSAIFDLTTIPWGVDFQRNCCDILTKSDRPEPVIQHG